MKGILMKPDMIQAIIGGRKTQSRRVIKPQPIKAERLINACGVCSWELYGEFIGESKPRYQVGETVYIKEAYKVIGTVTLRQGEKAAKEAGVDYKDGSRLDKVCPLHILADQQWHSPMMMPKWAARYFITITDVRAERLQEIIEADAEAEGMQIIIGNMDRPPRRWYFRNLWNSINKDYPWEMNPWVWVYSFRMAR